MKSSTSWAEEPPSLRAVYGPAVLAILLDLSRLSIQVDSSVKSVPLTLVVKSIFFVKRIHASCF